MREFVYDPARSFRGWLKTLAHHAWSDFLESRRRPGTNLGAIEVLRQLQDIEARDDLADRLKEEFDRELLDEAMARVRLQITPAKWEVFRLMAIEGMPGKGVAQLQKMKLSTAYVVRSKVQKLIQEEIHKLESPDSIDKKE